MANPTIERANLVRLLSTPNVAVVLVRTTIQGQIQVEAIGPGPLDRIRVLLSPNGTQNIIDFAPGSWWLNSTSLFSAVDNGFIDVITESSVQTGLSISLELQYIPQPPNPVIGDLLVFNGIGWDKLPAGPIGQVLTSNGPATVPSYQVNGNGSVTSVTALPPLSTSGTATDPVVEFQTWPTDAVGVLTNDGLGALSWGPGGTGGIGGTIANTQVAFGTALDTIGGSADITWSANTLAVNSIVTVVDGVNTLTLQPASIVSDAAALTLDAASTVQVGGTAGVSIGGVYTLPAVDGAAGEVLTTDGLGAASWAASSGGAPGTPLNSVQFNNAGSFGGSAGLTWDGSTLAVDSSVDRATVGTLTIGGTTANAITVGKAGVTTSFPGPVALNGTVTSVVQTQFVTAAQFDGNVTFGNAVTDNVSFVSQIDTAITQEGIAAPAVSPLTTGRIYFDSGSNKFRVSQNNGAYVDMLTGGTVTSVTLAASTTGLTISGGASQTITSSGTFTLGGTLAVANGGTGTATAFTLGSVVFAGASGAYAQDNNNLFWDDTNNRLGIGFVPVVTFSGILTLGSTTISLTTTAVCTVDASFDLFVPAGTVVIDVDTAGSVIARYGTGVLGNTLASSLQATVAILTATAVAGGGLTLPSGFYTTTTVASSSRTLSSTLNVGTTGQFQVSAGGDIVAIRGQTTTFPAANASGVLTNNGSGTFSWSTVSAANGGTGQTSYAIGDLLYASGTTALSKLADVATGNALISGGVGVAPSYGKVGLTTHVSGTLAVANGGTGATTAFTQGSVVFAGASGVYTQDNANLFFNDGTNSLGIRTATPNEALTVNGVVSLAEGASPSNTAAFGKLWANGAADARPYWTDDTGTSFNLTLDRFNTLAYGLTPGSVAIDTSPALPVFNSLALSQNTTFTTSNLGNGRSASVRVVGDASTRTLTFPSGPTGWTWLGSGPPASLAAGDVGYLSITAYGTADTDVVAAWSSENQPAAVVGSGVDNQISIWSGTNSQDGSANLTFNGTTLGVTGGITQTGGAVSLTGNASSSLTTSSGALTLTSAVAATWSTTVGDLSLTATANSVVVTGAEAAADAITLTASNVAGGVDVNAGTGGVTIDTTAAFSIDGATASNVTVTGSAQSLTLSAAGGGAQKVLFQSAGTGVDAVDLVATAGGFSIDGVAASNVTATGADLTVSTATSGSLNLTSAAAVNVTSASNLQISANGNATTWPTAAGTSGQVLANIGPGTLSWTAMPANGGLTPKLGNVLVVDAINGSDGTGTVNGPPFLTVEAAIAYINTNLLTGVTVWIMPGAYTFASPTTGITIPATCSLRGMSTQTTRLVMNAVNPGGMVTMITMGENSRVEDVSITLNSSNATTNLTGIALPGATSTTSKLRTMVLTVDNSGLAVGDTTNVYGIHDSGTGTVGPSSFSFNFTRGVTINVLSNGGGIKRGVLVDGPNDIIFRDTNFYVKEPSSVAATGSYVGIESNNNDASVQLRSCSVGAPPFIFTNTKLPVVVAETTNIALSGVYVLQGVTLTAGMQVLAAGQTIGTDNGIWVVKAGAWTRATDMPAGSVALNATTTVYGGTYAYTTWVCTTTGVVGAVPLTFAQQGYTGSDILQTLPVTGLVNTGLQVGPGCDLINKSAGGKAFTTYVTPKTLDFGQFANIAAAVRYMWPGTLNNLDATEIFYRFQQNSIVQGMFINLRTPPGVGKSLTVIVHRSSTGIADSGFSTLMTATISGTDRSAGQYTVSEVFQRNEYLSVQVSATGPGAADLIVELDLF